MEAENSSINVMELIRKRMADYAKIYIDDGCIVLDYVYPYYISLDRCDTPEKILGWCEQLSHKTWITKDRLLWFMQIAFKQIGIEVGEADGC